MENKLQELERLYDRVVQEVPEPDQQSRYLLRLYNDLIILLSEASQLHFNTLFARVSFITTRYPMDRIWAYALQMPRRELRQRELSDDVLLPVLHSVLQYLFLLCRAEQSGMIELSSLSKPLPPTLPFMRKDGRFKKKYARVVAIEWDSSLKRLVVLDEDEPDSTFVVHYAVHDRNEIFSETLELAIKEIGLPLILGLTDVTLEEEGHYIPSYIIIMPDLLMDVTSVVGLYSDGADPPAFNIMDQFLPQQTSVNLLVGNVANHFLDELIRDTTIPFRDLFVSAFRLYPVEFSRMDDDKVRQIDRILKLHYSHISDVIENRFPTVGIERTRCVIEPSYFSPRFGIKGRLDLYHEAESGDAASIIELKSSGPFRPNSYGLSSAHYHQTLLYDLMIRSSHQAGFKRSNFILYSNQSMDTLRYAATVESIQKETIHNRNQWILLLQRMANLDHPDTVDLFAQIDPDLCPDIKGYVRTHIVEWHKMYAGLSPGERKYFRSFTAFVTREHTLARIGSDKGDGAGGLAGLWLDAVDVKEERYQLLQGLELERIGKEQRQTTIRFQRTARTNPLANFRAGDIAIMYPYEEGLTQDPTLHQLHRANVLEVTATHVEIRLRNVQIHTESIDSIRLWNLEHDLLDSSFRSLYRSLWLLMSADVMSRQYILGVKAPPVPVTVMVYPAPGDLSETQLKIYQEGIRSEKMYLLWGPPGTGKTSMMLRSWVWYYFHHTNCRIALLAYTNKAVDEICEALQQNGAEMGRHFIRIGSSSATGEAYRDRLLDNVISTMTRRTEILELLANTRIFVATIASIQGRSELFNLINMDVVIMDEASQLLDPSIVGLLTRFEKAILIGDHMQLPAVTTQPASMCQIRLAGEWSERIGLSDMGMSYFERLYRLYQQRGWFHLMGTLYEQGRMHESIQSFANEHVYKGLLRVVDVRRQSKRMEEDIGVEDAAIFNERLIYIPSQTSLEEIYRKTNASEAELIIALVQIWKKKLLETNREWQIGVITPFRAQIAAIMHLAHQHGLEMKGVTVDTVERYQGGARDIIIMSCAANQPQTLTRITSVNADGVDRKLNVAVTRARQQFILLGVEEILKHQDAYALLMRMCCRIEPELIFNR